MSKALFEELPTEILEEIFLRCLNGNLFVASPRIAHRLSGNDSLCRTAFAVAFYAHQLHDVLDHLSLSFMIPLLPDPVSPWMARSITKAVLRARWCINSWVLEFSRNLLSAAVDRLSQRSDLISYAQRVIQNYKVDLSDTNSRKFWSAHNDRRNEVASLEGSHPLQLEFTTAAEGSSIFFADDTDDENSITMFQFTMTFCGAGLERHECLSFLGMDGDRMFRVADKPFSEYMNLLICNTTGINDKETERFWTDLGRVYRGPVGDDWYEECDRLYWRFNWRQQVAIDYFLSPENSPFRIPSLTFRRAAVSDLRNRHCPERRDGIGHHFRPCFIHFIFEIDPTSLPRKDPIVLRWAVRACERIRHFGDAYQRDRIEHREHGVYDEGDWEYQSTRRNQVFAKYTFDVEVRMIRYIKTGENPYPPDCPAPYLHNPITQLEATLVPGIDMAGDDENDIVEDDYSDEEEIAALNRWHREQICFGPNPPELGFLDHDDYRDQRVIEHDGNDSDAGALESWEADNLGDPAPEQDWDVEGPPNVFENGSFEIQVINDPAKDPHVAPLLDPIATELRQHGKVYWLSANDCHLPSQFHSDFKWYKKR
ncbi:uncharacterized protein A1O9_00315 [Exophiala aquamarina CBS 119918]|uniref:Uncharacterized protein n=1 Tax=Exophiala aquamarina CBS 119918 TaxID=1182545 RepID=A0A072PSP6_9EURO|nr:uncharacterized protein A1O9_00315 [Exophiala aquamarina CBS 119918]KEF62343.1 hypothetical protein A1O9_00315 [Exophiala aquamarina CBS 119918]